MLLKNSDTLQATFISTTNRPVRLSGSSLSEEVVCLERTTKLADLITCCVGHHLNQSRKLLYHCESTITSTCALKLSMFNCIDQSNARYNNQSVKSMRSELFCKYSCTSHVIVYVMVCIRESSSVSHVHRFKLSFLSDQFFFNFLNAIPIVVKQS